MKNLSKLGLLVVVMSLALVGCGKKDNEPTAFDSLKNLKDLSEAVQSGDDAATTNAITQMVADAELKEYSDTKPVDAPENFPENLIYNDGKIISASDNSSGSDFDLSIDIKTTDDLDKVKEFYKKVLEEDSWKITNQTNRSDGADYSATKNEGNQSLSLYISRYQMSKITEISLDFNQYNQ